MFQKLHGDQALFQKAVFILGNLVGVGLALYKVNSMGLLPTAQSDWLEFMEIRDVSVWVAKWLLLYTFPFCYIFPFLTLSPLPSIHTHTSRI